MRKVALTATLLSLALLGSAAAQAQVAVVTGGVYGVSGYGGLNYCPAGYTPVTPPNTLPPNVTGVGYCQPVATMAYSVPVVTTPVVVSQPVVTARVAYAVPVATTAVAYSAPVITTPLVTRVAYVSSRRTPARQVALRTAPAGRRVALRKGRTIQAQQAVATGRTARVQRVGFRAGQAQGRMGAMNRARTY